MSSRSLSLGWCVALSALVVGLTTACGGGTPQPPPPPPVKAQPDAGKSTVVVNRGSGVLANGRDSVTITVTVRDESGAAMADRTVTLEVSGDGNTLTPASGKTGGDGVLAATLVSTRPGIKQVTASVATDGAPVVLSARPTVEFVALQASKVGFTNTSIQATAGATLPVIEVALQDADGATVRGATSAVTLVLASGPAAAELAGTLTVNAVDGVARFSDLRINKAGSGYSLRATSGSLGAATSVTFDVVPAAASVVELTGLPASMVAGETATGSLLLKDAFGNVATNYVGTLRFSSSDNTAVLPADALFTAADAGQKAFPALSLRRAGTQQVTVTDVANAAVTASVDVQVLAADASRLVFTQQPGTRSVRETLGTVQVTLTDAYGNLAAVGSPTVSLAMSSGSVTLNGTRVVAPVDGVASFTTLSIDQEGTGYTLTATAGTLTSATSAAFDIIDNVPPARPVLSPGTSGPSSIVVQWTAVGDDGTLGTASSQELRYSSTNIVTDADFAAATLVTTGAPKPAGGAESATLTGLAVGTNYYVALRVVDSAGNAVRSATLPVSTSNPTVTQLAFITQPVNGTAGTALPQVRVALQDANGDTVTSANSAVTLNLLNGPAFTPVTVTAMAGVATFSGLRVDTAGSGYRFRATAGSLAVESNPFSIQPGPAARLDMVGLVAPVTSGQPGTVQVTAMDAFDNVATGYTGTVRFTSTDAAATLPGNYTFTAADAGRKVFTNAVVLRASGPVTVTVTDTGNAALTDSLSVMVDSGVAEQLVLTVPAAPVTAGGDFPVTVTLRDGAGNIASGYRGTVTFTSTDASAVLPGNYTFTAADAGQKTFSSVQLRTAGSRSITARDTGTATLTDTENVTVNPAAVSALTFSAPATATAGSPFSVTVSAVDAFANVVPGYTGTVQFSSGDAQATLPGDYTFTAADAGSRMFNVTLASAGSRTLTVTDGTRSATATVAVSAGAAQSLAITAPASATAGSNFSVTVRALDAFNNVATGYRGTVQFASSDAAAELPGSYTFTAVDAGTATFSVQLRTAGSSTVSVTDTVNGGLTASATVTVVANSPSQLVFIQQPANGTVRTTLAEVRVALRDAYGNDVNVSLPQVTLSLTGGSASAVLSGTLTKNPSAGVASFDNLSINQEGTGFQLTASAQGLTGATSAPFTIVDNIIPDTAVITATPASLTSINVAWLAVGDDGNLGTAAEYDLRYSTSPINNETDFGNATRFVIPAPRAPGTAESATITGVNLVTAHYVALKVLDGAGNFSRSASVQVQGDACAGVVCTPPPATCTADGTSTVTYVSACQPATGTCQDTSTTTRCQAFETCSAGACVPVTPGSQGGEIIISEFSALGAEFIELHNPTAASIDVAGYTLRNAAGMMADVRAVTDPNGTAATPVTIAAGGSVYGIPNPAGAIPGGVGFVYGAPGTTFSLADTGDALALYKAAPAGNLQDAVDFRSFVTDPNTPLTAVNFVGFAGNSTQLEPTMATAAGNDTATNWCVSFYGAGVRGSRIPHTAGAANGSCKVAVINEALIDPSGGDDGKGFFEIAGPGGSVIGGAKLADVEGRSGNVPGTYNAMAEATIPAGVRIPADGILLVADGVGTTTNTQVPNFVANVDVRIANLDAENNGGDAIQLFMPGTPNVLLDTVGYDPTGAALAVNIATPNGLEMYEGATALYMNPGASVGPSMVRSPTSTDSNNNRNDFRWDPSPTPGLPNDTVNLTVTSITPDDVPNTVASTTITVTGTDFGPLTAKFGANPVGSCNVTSNTQATCTAVGSATPSRVSVVFSNGVAVGVPDVTLAGGFTYTGNYNESNDPLEADYCNLQFPSSIPVQQAGQMTQLIYGRIYEAGVTEAGGAPAGVVAEVGYGPAAADPRSTNTWRFFQASYNTQTGNDDEFQGSFVAPAAGSYSYTYRFSFDNGVRWTYCDVNGAGSGPGLLFETTQLGAMTVNP
ncbi:MAG TPA: Ig-like domain-containing protein [Myxococcaceae bacterium]|nr:Ig-like domain-containing protein [Myxococcaceae bacterium]